MARKVFTAVAHIGISIGLVGASYAGCDPAVVVALFCLGMGSMGLYYPGTRVNVLDLSPNYSGILLALVNGIGAISGIFTPYLVGVLTPNRTAVEWRTVFWITAAVNIITLAVFVIFGSGEVQPWNDVRNIHLNESEETGEENDEVKTVKNQGSASTTQVTD